MAGLLSRGKRKKGNSGELTPSILEPDGSTKEYRKDWTRLIQKIYEVDPLTCPKRSGKMKVISVIEDENVLNKILKHLGLWDQKAKPPPKATASPPHFRIDYSHRGVGPYGPEADSQAPSSDDYLFHDPEYSIEVYTR